MNEHLKFAVTLTFGGEFCPMLPAKTFVVYAINADVAIRVATYDAMNQGYKSGWVVGHNVEVL